MTRRRGGRGAGRGAGEGGLPGKGVHLSFANVIIQELPHEDVQFVLYLARRLMADRLKHSHCTQTRRLPATPRAHAHVKDLA